MRKLKTSNGYTFLVDNEDYNKVIQWSWYGNDTKSDYVVIQRTGYCKEYYKKTGYCSKTIKLSRFLMGVTDRHLTVDHIDNNPLNNQRSNLRICTQKENSRNKSPYKNSTSKYLGVHRIFPDRKNGEKRYRATIRPPEGRIQLGVFANETEAAKAYNVAAKKIYGKYANLNKV